MRILLVENEPELRQLVLFMLESKFGAEVIEAESGNEAIEKLQMNKNIDLVVSNYEMPKGTGADIYRYLQDQTVDIPFILCSANRLDQLPEFKDKTIYGFVEKPFINKPLSEIITQFVSASKKPIQYTPPRIPGFSRIKITSLQMMSALACDLYLKLSGEKYVKVVREGDFFEKDDYDRFNKKGVEYLYLPQESAELFLTKLTHEVLSLRSAKVGTSNEVQLITRHIQNLIHELSLDLGFTPEVQELTKSNVNLALNVIGGNKKLSELLQPMLENNDAYITSHSIALAHVACGLATKMQWPTENTLFKLTLAAFLHDITLSNQEVAQFRTEEALLQSLINSKKFSEEEVAAYKKHPINAALIASQFREIPPDVDTIIAQHHELPDGKGFPNHLNHLKIFPLACLFIVAHDLVSYFWVNKGQFKMDDFLKLNEERYSVGHFKKIAVQMALDH